MATIGCPYLDISSDQPKAIKKVTDGDCGPHTLLHLAAHHYQIVPDSNPSSLEKAIWKSY
jgi:hypothetical protein